MATEPQTTLDFPRKGGNAVSIISIALQLLAAKVVLILALGMSFGTFCWALWAHTWVALASAVSFAVLVFLPILWKGDRNA